VRLNDETRQVERVGGVKWTIKDGIVYDAKQLLADVEAMVEKQKRERATRTTTRAESRGRRGQGKAGRIPTEDTEARRTNGGCTLNCRSRRRAFGPGGGWV
jgi:hypothetical protein